MVHPVNLDRDARWISQSPTTLVVGATTAFSGSTTKVCDGTGTLYTDRFQGVLPGTGSGIAGSYVACGVGFEGRTAKTPYHVSCCIFGENDQSPSCNLYVGTYASQTSATNCQLIASGHNSLNYEGVVIVDGTSDVYFVMEYYFTTNNSQDKFFSIFIQDLTSPDTDYVKVAP
jgi:hypothetical protein